MEKGQESMVGDMMKYLLIIPLLLLLGCMEQNAVESVDLISAFDFDSGAQDWEGGISDYPINYEDSTDYQLSNIQVPGELLMQGKGLNISAENPHGDLFYYFKRHIAGLAPNTNYKLDFEFLVYTQRLEESTDLASPELVKKIVARIKRFNFGPKEGVPKVTILYPIAFLPAT